VASPLQIRPFETARMRVVPLRLRPGDDLRQALESWMAQQNERAGCVISAIGSLSTAQVRFAGRDDITAIAGELEILSLAGTLSPDGAHLHIAIADGRGAVSGGHLCAGSLVRTTAELVVGLLPDWEFRRAFDAETGSAELVVTQQRDDHSPQINAIPQLLDVRLVMEVSEVSDGEIGR